MCRSIKTLRPPFQDVVTSEDISAASLQYVRKIHRISVHQLLNSNVQLGAVTGQPTNRAGRPKNVQLCALSP